MHYCLTAQEKKGGFWLKCIVLTRINSYKREIKTPSPTKAPQVLKKSTENTY